MSSPALGSSVCGAGDRASWRATASLGGGVFLERVFSQRERERERERERDCAGVLNSGHMGVKQRTSSECVPRAASLAC